uniref:Uncharacterized protein n=1 Tax=viral metagenome TaxID=1070528 RepID=A0A6C0BV64_9ZZZZ
MDENFHDAKEIELEIDPEKLNNDIGKEIIELKSKEIEKEKIKLEKQKSVESSPKSNKSIDYEIDFDYLVFNDDSESDDEIEDEHGIPIQNWSKTKKHRLQKCLWKLKYNRIISSFYLNDLKKQEEKYSWWIIVISTITSGLTIANNVESPPFENYDIYINTALTLSSMGTSLIAAWIKKQQFVEKINEVDKYLININSLCEEIDVQFMLLEKDRIPYKEFKEKYIPQITNYVSSNPMIPPESWKRCVKEITLKYPQLIEPDNNDENKLWPWFGDMVEVTDQNGDSKLVRKPTKFMKYMLKKDKKTRLKSSCCFDVEERNSVYQ